MGDREWSEIVTRLRRERDEARAECEEQARLLGMSAEREVSLRAENERLHQIEASVDVVTADWAQRCQELERLLAERVDDHTADLTRITRERDEAERHLASLQNRFAQVTTENERLQKANNELRHGILDHTNTTLIDNDVFLSIAQDAERYWWLKRQQYVTWAQHGYGLGPGARGHKLDVVIDAAREGE